MATNLEAMSRVELLEFAQQLNVNDADVMTRPELRSAIQGAQQPRRKAKESPVTWLGVARRLVASVIEQGLNLPEAASLVRGEVSLGEAPPNVAPVATVTLARIYAAQGHVQRAVDTLQDVLNSEPDHDPARELHERLHNKLVQEVRAADARPDEPENVTVAKGNSAKAPEPEAAKGSEVVGTPNDAANPISPMDVDVDVEPEPEPEVTAVPPKVRAISPPEGLERNDAVAGKAGQVDSQLVKAPPPSLVLVHTEDEEVFAFWQGASESELRLVVVAHGVSSASNGRAERSFDLDSNRGLVELTGLETSWILRALLRGNTEAGQDRVLAVAGVVRSTSGRDSVTVEYSPHAGAIPEDIGTSVADGQTLAPVIAW